MHKKNYQKPIVKKVRLDVRSAVLGTCRQSGAPLSERDNLSDCRILTIGCQT